MEWRGGTTDLLSPPRVVVRSDSRVRIPGFDPPEMLKPKRGIYGFKNIGRVETRSPIKSRQIFSSRLFLGDTRTVEISRAREKLHVRERRENNCDLFLYTAFHTIFGKQFSEYEKAPQI
jgi:hypothetical protein